MVKNQLLISKLNSNKPNTDGGWSKDSWNQKAHQFPRIFRSGWSQISSCDFWQLHVYRSSFQAQNCFSHLRNIAKLRTMVSICELEVFEALYSLGWIIVTVFLPVEYSLNVWCKLYRFLTKTHREAHLIPVLAALHCLF